MFSALDVISMQSNIYDNGIEKRKTSQISEIIGVINGIELQDSFSWNPLTDEFEFKGSKVLQDIGDEMGWTDEKIIEEISRRSMFLDMMLEKGIRDYDLVIQWINTYKQDTEYVMEYLISGEHYHGNIFKNAQLID
jgi:flagellar protein FlaI